jgi:ATP-dependent DNA helicase RecQ
VEELGHPTVLALTATASPQVRAEIIRRVNMRDPRVIVHGFDRPNIWLGVETAASDDKKRALLLDRIRHAERPGIVYATTRKHAEEIKEELNNVRIPAAFYHGGLRKRERIGMQEQFMRDQVEVIVATSAFGMGVDKANVRVVFHYEPPGSLDSYYQEIGRGGRDGGEASAVLFYRSGDLNVHKFFKGAGQICAEEVHSVLREVQTGGVSGKNFAVGALSKIKVARILRRLEDSGAIHADPEGTLHLTARADELHAIAGEAAAAQLERHQADLERIKKMQQYAENLACRRALLLGYFGEETSGSCGNCDNCQGDGTERARLIFATQVRAAEPAQIGRREGCYCGAYNAIDQPR